MSNTFPTIYCGLSDLIQELALVRDDDVPNRYIIWQVPVEQDTLDHFVTQANQWTTTLFGSINQVSSPSTYALAVQYATKWASLRLLQTMATQWQVSGLPLTVGGITIARLPALQAAMTETKERLTQDLNKLYIMLSSIDIIDSGSQLPHSTYLDTHGQSNWP
jgi:hypothetical protein